MSDNLVQLASLNSIYTYQPLGEDSSIRLLTLLPGRWDSSIQCKLDNVALEPTPQYEALSYVWGDPAETRQISLDGHAFQVTHNLEIALRHLRHEKESRTLWVDALCIDQNNIPERNQQVRQMGSVYRSAHTVLAWLGEEADGSNEALALIREIHDKTAKLHTWDTREAWATPQILKDAGFDADTKDWNPIWHLFDRPYWGRIWIIQEQFFSGRISDGFFIKKEEDRCVFGCGNEWVPRPMFLSAWRLLYRAVSLFEEEFFTTVFVDGNWETRSLEPLRSRRINHHVTGLNLFEMLEAQFHSKMAGAKMSYTFSQFMRRARQFGATDPRDRIFALLGIFDGWFSDFPIDYSVSYEDTLKEVVKFLIITDRSLIILEGNRSIASNISSLPSWLPNNWRSCSWNYAGCKLDASEERDCEPPRFDTAIDIIYLTGISIGTICKVIGPIEFKSESDFEICASQIEQNWKQMDTNSRETFWRTLVLDRDNATKPWTLSAPDHYRELFVTAFITKALPSNYKPFLPQMERFESYTEEILAAFIAATDKRCYFEIDNGMMGIGPYHTEPDDLVVLLIGSPTCFVLRRHGEHYRLIGDAYVNGVMNGELIKTDEEGKYIGTQEFGLC